MGVRPPGGDTDDEPDVIEFGIAALDAILEDADISFPTTTESLKDAIGDQQVAYDASGNTVPVANVLERIDRVEFADQDELLDAAHPIFEQYRAEGPSGLIAWLRSLVSG